MSGDFQPYVVKQGDYLAKLAFLHGFDAEAVWNDAKNEDLRTRRRDPDVLFPGDIIYIPVRTPSTQDVTARSSNDYEAEIPMTEVSLVFEGSDGKAIASEPCEVRGLVGASDAPPQKMATDGSGTLKLEVPVTTRELEVAFPAHNVIFHVGIGDLDPDDELPGVRKRLRNLGFLSLDPNYADDDDMLPGALSAFQGQHGLPQTGQLDEATRKLLLDKHGK
jgi:hypothetical protein